MFASLTNPVVLCAVLGSDFLSEREVGRVLLRTKKDVGDSVKDGIFVKEEHLWTKLCNYHWGEGTAAKLLKIVPSAQACFYPPPRVTPSVRPRRPLKYAPADYVLIVQAKVHGKGNLLNCFVASCADSPGTFGTGWFLRDSRFHYFEKKPLERLPRYSYNLRQSG